MKKRRKLDTVLLRNALIATGAFLLLTVMLAFSSPQSGSAAPGDLSSAIAKYPKLAGTSLDSCSLCHTSAPSLNSYGSAYKAKGRNTAAFKAIESLDSDKDGFTNIQEINALTFPGNANSHPAGGPTSPPPAPTKTSAPPPTKTSAPNPTNTNPPPASTATSVPNNPTNTPIPPTLPPAPSATPTTVNTSASVTTSFVPANIVPGGSSTASVSLNNVPAEGFASVEFTCTYNPAVVEVSNILFTELFGSDSVTVTNGPQNGSFIVAIAGSNGKKATTAGTAFTFSVKGLQIGQPAVDCQARVSTGNLVLVTIPASTGSLIVGSGQGTITGQILAGKPVTITLYDPGNVAAGSVSVNADGTYNLQGAAGTYTVIASAPGYLRAQGSVNITSGATVTLPSMTLLAGDIDGNDVIDQFDALTIGINYNGSAPAAADLNNDGIINVLDLEILSRNYHQTGPLAWH